MIRSLHSLPPDQLVAERVLTAASTTIDLTLKIQPNDSIRLVLGLLWASAGGATIELNGAGNSTGINVRVVSGYSGGPGTAESFAPASGTIAGGDASGSSLITATISLIGSRMMMVGQTVRSYGTGHLWDFSAFGAANLASISNILIRCSVVNGFSAGSFMRVLRA